VRWAQLTRRVWRKGGLYTAGTATLLAVFLELPIRAGAWHQATIWYRALVFLNYPAGELTPAGLNRRAVPRLYGAPLTWREALIVNLTG